MNWAEEEEFKDPNSVSKRNVSPCGSRNYRGSKRKELSLGRSLWELGASCYKEGLNCEDKKDCIQSVVQNFLARCLSPSGFMVTPLSQSGVCESVMTPLSYSSCYLTEGNHSNSLDCKRFREGTHSQLTLSKTSMTLHLSLGAYIITRHLGFCTIGAKVGS